MKILQVSALILLAIITLFGWVWENTLGRLRFW